MREAALFVPHRHPGKLRQGRLLARPNRFLGVVEVDGATAFAHIADRGRLEQLLFPGAEVFLAPATGAERRTTFSLVCARAETGVLVSIEPAGANRLVRALLEAGLLDLPPIVGIRQEVKVGSSRFDFSLALASGDELLLEVKSAGAAVDRTALFPDAPSERASRHTLELAERARAGGPAAIVLVAQRGDVDSIAPHPVDPAFAESLAVAREAGVLVRGAVFSVELDGFRYLGAAPVLPGVPA